MQKAEVNFMLLLHMLLSAVSMKIVLASSNQGYCHNHSLEQSKRLLSPQSPLRLLLMAKYRANKQPKHTSKQYPGYVSTGVGH